MKRRLLYMALLLLCDNLVMYGQHMSVGSRSAGLSHASCALHGEWAVFNNPSAMPMEGNIRLSVFVENKFLLNHLNAQAFAGSFPLKQHSSVGFGFSGLTQRQNTLGLVLMAYSIKLAKTLKAGISGNYWYHQTNQFYKTNHKFSCTVGLLFEPANNLVIGFSIVNPTRSNVAKFANEKLPSVLRLGFAYVLSKKVQWVLEIEKDILMKPNLKVGIEYCPRPKISIRSGYCTSPSQFSFGFGYQYHQIILNLSSSYNLTLGPSSQLGLSFVRRKKAPQ